MSKAKTFKDLLYDLFKISKIGSPRELIKSHMSYEAAEKFCTSHQNTDTWFYGYEESLNHSNNE